MELINADFGGARITGHGIGPVLEEFGGVSRIAVLRGGGLGDLMYALPAVAALKAAYPGASVTLLCAPVQAELLSQTVGPVDETVILPFAEGVRPGPEDPHEVERFVAGMRARNFDLAVQVHGGGRYSNPFLLRLGARHTVGTRTPDAAPLERTVPYVYYQHEPLRALEVAGFAGAPPRELEARLQALPEFIQRLGQALPLGNGGLAKGGSGRGDGGPGHGRVLVIHPGATDPRRRWPAERFAAVARRAADDGFRVYVVGDSSEKELAETVVELALEQAGTGQAGTGHAAEARPAVESLAGNLSLGELAALLTGSTVVVANDSGPRHLAQALGTSTVGIYWAGNAINAAPLGRSKHRVRLGWVTRCPVCGVDVTQVGWTAPRCPHDESTVKAVEPSEVYEDVLQLTAMSPLPHGR
ncbi:putative glycosyltransferase [Arthrobacter globiformis NBRC 12137]|uniref:Putative glycosyltransferase n=1 Tax=Arthrobacter globiformis (strain ATCC 8010 / DSM 20124 / JCM 1332 / NBRC 12137 / NCIMB 8907 / NRRL B-2979 / 168) TaxID=1077972 RepID=H0QIU2_ARTG1|nr:glycosyltransferase family 9 protein [Arthrobacter globiformis]GAB12743.1 putative glycosyltransferase [Arthrobacter globiformis NBRC 12137]